jgi:hypothetical protein
MNGLECIFDCAMNATGAVENGKPNPQKLIAKATGALAATPEWIPIVTAGINYCLNQLSVNMQAIKTSLKGEQINGKDICSPSAAFFYGCMFTYEFRNCPVKMWTGSKECNDLKTYFNQCPTPQIN